MYLHDDTCTELRGAVTLLCDAFVDSLLSLPLMVLLPGDLVCDIAAGGAVVVGFLGAADDERSEAPA